MSSPVGEPGAAVRAAATIGDCATLGRLLPARGPARFTRDAQGRTAVHLAAANGRAQALRMLLAIAAAQEVDARDGAGCTALHRAAADGHEEVMRALLAKGAKVDTVDTMHCNTALHECAWKGHSRTVRLLCAAGAPLSAANAGGFAPLHLACQNGHNQSCRELLLAGADPDLRNGYGDTALHTAARYGHAGVTRILISAKCKVSERNKNGDTALHIAAAMGRRKLTRILLEAGCDKGLRNKQGETARDIALRKDLGEILDILDDAGGREGRRSKKEKGAKRRSKSKVRFEGKPGKDVVDISITESTIPTKPPPTSSSGNNKWSPYGCHYYPDPEAFPSPNLDSLPPEPLKKGEQYYLDLAGNICKGPVGVGYTCYCAPLFRHLEAKIERDKRELQRAQVRLGQKVAGLEQRICRGAHGRRSERMSNLQKEPEPQLSRSRSLEMLDKGEKSNLQSTRSMDELEDPQEGDPQGPRPSVKELVARIQQQHQHSTHNDGNHSESSDDEDGPLRMPSRTGLMGDSNLVQVPLGQPPGAIRLGHYENVPNEVINPRSRSGVYSPAAVVDQTMVDSASRYIEPIVKIQEPTVMRYPDSYKQPYSNQPHQPSTSKYDPINPYQPEMRYNDPAYHAHYYEDELPNPSKFYEHSMSARLAKLRVLESSKGFPESKNPIEGSSRMLDPNFGDTRVMENPHDTIDRDTNNDSGYSTKVYGSSKGNSPSLSGQGELLGASSLV